MSLEVGKVSVMGWILLGFVPLEIKWKGISITDFLDLQHRKIFYQTPTAHKSFADKTTIMTGGKRVSKR